MALSANRPLTRFASEEIATYPVGAAVHIYLGGLVGIDPAGYAKAFVPGDVFVGQANAEADNSSGAAGAINVDVIQAGNIEFALTSVAYTDAGRPVYATADDAIAFSGHPDAYVGRVVAKSATNKAVIRLKAPGEKAPNGDGCVDMLIDFAQVLVANQDEGTATLKVGGSAIKTAAIGAGLTAGTTGFLHNEATGELRMLIDNDNEAENLTIETPQVLNITKGATFDITIKLEAAGGAATDDLDFGLMGLSGGITATERADMNATTSGLLSALFHVDTNGLDLKFSSDDNAAPVTATDTTVDLVLQTAVNCKIIVRPTGAVEVWVGGTRYLSSTAFSVGASGLLAGIVNIEKSTGTGVPEVRVRKLRAAGALA